MKGYLFIDGPADGERKVIADGITYINVRRISPITYDKWGFKEAHQKATVDIVGYCKYRIPGSNLCVFLDRDSDLWAGNSAEVVQHLINHYKKVGVS